MLGAVSLDLFAVLLGGATALLPIYAKDILHTGSWGQGLLRSAPAVGALLMSIYLSHSPIQHRVGKVMFGGVALFGVVTVIFGLSTSFMLSLLALGLSGVGDMISVVIRQSLVQLDTPDEMRGRVSAVSGSCGCAGRSLHGPGMVGVQIGIVRMWEATVQPGMLEAAVGWVRRDLVPRVLENMQAEGLGNRMLCMVLRRALQFGLPPIKARLCHAGFGNFGDDVVEFLAQCKNRPSGGLLRGGQVEGGVMIRRALRGGELAAKFDGVEGGV